MGDPSLPTSLRAAATALVAALVAVVAAVAAPAINVSVKDGFLPRVVVDSVVIGAVVMVVVAVALEVEGGSSEPTAFCSC